MNTAEAASPRGGMRRSHQVALVLLGTAGVAGLVVAYDAWRRHSPDTSASSVEPAGVPLQPERAYANNDYVPGVGYYHAPYHAWFPYPYNYHDPSRGYFAGGMWQAIPWIAALTQSQPTSSAFASAAAARRRYEDQQRQQPRSSFFGSGSHSGGWFSSSHPGSSTPSAPRPGIIRGGFGSSSHFSGS